MKGVEETRTCSGCRKTKPLTEFRVKGGRRVSRCSLCLAQESREWRRRNPDRVRRNRLAWNEAHPDAVKEHQRRKVLKARYGITPDELDEMIERQGGVCAIEGCGGPAERVDHDHATGAVRGVLCHACNLWLAPLEADQSAWRRAAEDYIKRSEERYMKKYGTGQILPEPDGTGEVLPEPGEPKQGSLSEEDKEKVLTEGEDAPTSSE